jgi:hypothetical protein
MGGKRASQGDAGLKCSAQKAETRVFSVMHNEYDQQVRIRSLFSLHTIVAVLGLLVSSPLPVLSGVYDGPPNDGWSNSLRQRPSTYSIDSPGKVPAWAPRGLTTAELHALRALCLSGINANGIWGSDRINIAIITLAFGSDWPDSPSAAAYKVCSYAGSINPRRS